MERQERDSEELVGDIERNAAYQTRLLQTARLTQEMGMAILASLEKLKKSNPDTYTLFLTASKQSYLTVKCEQLFNSVAFGLDHEASEIDLKTDEEAVKRLSGITIKADPNFTDSDMEQAYKMGTYEGQVLFLQSVLPPECIFPLPTREIARYSGFLEGVDESKGYEGFMAPTKISGVAVQYTYPEGENAPIATVIVNPIA